MSSGRVTWPSIARSASGCQGQVPTPLLMGNTCVRQRGQDTETGRALRMAYRVDNCERRTKKDLGKRSALRVSGRLMERQSKDCPLGVVLGRNDPAPGPALGLGTARKSTAFVGTLQQVPKGGSFGNCTPHNGS